MEGMEKVREAIIDKVKAEAQQIIREAEEKAQQEIQEAEAQRETKFEAEKRKMLEEAGGEATIILAQASLKGRQELSKAKAEIINGLVSRVKSTLLGISSDEGSLRNLIIEAVNELAANEARILVSTKDMDTAQKLLKEDSRLARKVKEVKEFDCTGGVVAEDITGKLSIDNTYDTRLEMLLPQILPEINKELFKIL